MGRRRMASPYIFDMLVMLVAVASASTVLCSSQDDFFQCENTVKNWAASSHADGVKGVRLTLRDLLFFLHVPRTGGRTYFHCFLNKLYTSDLKCPRSYDRLRFNPSKPNCRLLVTHDDYSVMSKLPKESTSVVTILRDPVDRVFSTYEFSVEVAARFLVHPNLTSATQMTGRIRPKSRGVSTLNIWPWKYLVPWMREDLFGREARKLRKVMGVRNGGDSYDMEDIVMPLHAFINDPLAHEIIHNGATFQVAGLTNNSYLTESHEVHQCVRKHPVLGQYVLDVAKERLDNMLYVGLTEEHKESAMIFANAVGVQVLSLLETLGSHVKKAVDNRTELSSSFPDSDLDTSSHLENSINEQRTRRIESTDENTAVAKLIEDYEVCVSSLRKSQAVRRVSSLKRISPVNFTKEARLQVPEAVIQQIMSLNSLDMELYKHAQNIFAKQQKHLAQKAVKAEIQESSFGCCAWEVTLLAIITILFTVAFIFRSVISRRNMKLKI